MCFKINNSIFLKISIFFKNYLILNHVFNSNFNLSDFTCNENPLLDNLVLFNPTAQQVPDKLLILKINFINENKVPSKLQRSFIKSQ